MKKIYKVVAFSIIFAVVITSILVFMILKNFNEAMEIQRKRSYCRNQSEMINLLRPLSEDLEYIKKLTKEGYTEQQIIKIVSDKGVEKFGKDYKECLER